MGARVHADESAVRHFCVVRVVVFLRIRALLHSFPEIVYLPRSLCACI